MKKSHKYGKREMLRDMTGFLAILAMFLGAHWWVGSWDANAAETPPMIELEPVVAPAEEVVTAPEIEVPAAPREIEMPELLQDFEKAPEMIEKPEVEQEPEAEQAPVVEAPAYSEEDLEALAIIIYQEAGADYIEDSTRQMVGEVVLNRVASEYFPDTIAEVATQDGQYGRLSWTGLVWPERASYDCEAHAVERAYECAKALLTGSVERLLPEDAIWQAEFSQGAEILAYQDGIYFCR